MPVGRLNLNVPSIHKPGLHSQYPILEYADLFLDKVNISRHVDYVTTSIHSIVSRAISFSSAVHTNTWKRKSQGNGFNPPLQSMQHGI